MPHDQARTVLIVEDDPEIQNLVAMLLESEGCTAETADNGREALDVLSRKRPDLILLDMRMPVMDGWEFAAQLRARHISGIPIIVMTAAEDAKQRAEEIHADGLVGKPFDLQVLINTVKQHLPPADSRH